MALNLNALRLFAAVARAGSITRAAGLAHVSQPAISKAVRELERGLGVPLLERGARGVRLTEAGEILAGHARTLFGVAQTAEEELRALRGLERGLLRVGASSTIGTYALPPVLAEFTRRHPGIELRVSLGNTADVARRLAAYELDVALVEGPVTDERFVAEPWRQDELVLLAPRRHPLAGRRVRWVEVEREVLLVREAGSGTGDVVSAALAALRLAPGRTLELGSTEAIKRAVAAGLGLGFVSRAAAADQLRLRSVRPVAVRGLRIVRWFTRLAIRGRRPGAAAAAFDKVLARLPAPKYGLARGS
jgi:DNA-binding transcriptional LysR family regulator